MYALSHTGLDLWDAGKHVDFQGDLWAYFFKKIFFYLCVFLDLFPLFSI